MNLCTKLIVFVCHECMYTNMTTQDLNMNRSVYIEGVVDLILQTTLEMRLKAKIVFFCSVLGMPVCVSNEMVLGQCSAGECAKCCKEVR